MDKKNTGKRWAALLLGLLMLFGAACGENLWDDAPASDETVESGTEEALEQTVDQSGGVLVNPDPSHSFSQEQATAFSYTPLDVVLILDTSGSMSLSCRTGQQIISLAQESAAIFVETLFGLSASSRIGLVEFASSASPLSDGLLGLTDESRLKKSIYNTYAGGQTNTGAAFEEAGRMLGRETRPDARRVAIILTDGIPVSDNGNPVSHAIQAGRSLASGDTLVYTVGLVGALDAGDRTTTRKVLHDGYETRYFEVDNAGSVSRSYYDAGGYTYIGAEDVARELTDIFKSICLSAMSNDPDTGIYTLWVDDNMEIRVTPKTGDEYLCSDPGDYRDTASFGRLSIVGERKTGKSVTLSAGDYTVTVRGTRTGKGSYDFSWLQGFRMIPSPLASARDVNTHPAQVLRFDLSGGECTMTDLSWDPLDHTATDPFTGSPTRGSETAASGRVRKAEKLLAWMHKKAEKLLSLTQGQFVGVLASDPEKQWFLVSATDEDGRLCRGWVPAGSVAVDGYVPVLIADPEREYTVSADTVGRTAPAETSAESRKVKAGETVTAIHAERDIQGNEWAYVLLKDKKPRAVWVPGSVLEGWISVSPEGFRIGYALPTLLWQKSLGGKGYTEFMWAASRLDGPGTALSGRTSSSKGEIKAKYKNRDALALLLTPEGAIEKSAVLGGSGDMDSFHCILPAADGYYVSGVTRSNDRDFAGIWDKELYSGKTAKTHKRSNALIGKLNPDLSMDWMKSFGVGSKSFGFDMVIQTADGNIAGCGWLTRSDSFALRGNGAQDFLLMKLTPEGEVRDYACFGGSDEDVPDSAAATPDGGIIHVGKVGKKGSGTGQIFITDSALNQVNQVTYGGSRDCLFDNIRDLGDGTYLVTGCTDNFSASMDFWAMLIDGSGRMIWSKTYGGSAAEEVCGTTVLPDGRILLTGSTESTDGTVQGGTGKGRDAWALCIDSNGRELWQFTSGLKGDDYFNSAAVDPGDGGIVLCGACEYKSDKNAKGYIVKILAP